MGYNFKTLMIDCFKISKFFLYLTPFSVVIISFSTLFPFIVGKYAFFRGTISLALIFFLLGWAFQFKDVGRPYFGRPTSQILKSPLVIAVSIFVFIFVLAGFFGVNPSFSFWSNFERGEGGLQFIYLYLFFLLLLLTFQNKADWQKLFWISIAAAMLMIFYGIFRGVDFNERFQGPIGNPAYVAVYLIFALFYALYLLTDKYRHKLKSFEAAGLIMAIVLFLIFFFLAATRGAFLGLIAAILAAFLYLGFSLAAWRKKLAIAGILLVLTVGLLVNFRQTSFIQNLPGSRIFDISFYTENVKNRMVVWQMAFDGFKERPILGWGAENFAAVFDKHYNPEHYSVQAGFGAWYDRAHNVFLDYLISAGALGLLSFIGIFGAFYWQFIRFNQQQSLVSGALLFALPIAYLVQGMVLFDILPTSLNLFLFLAFSAYVFNSFQNSGPKL